MGKVETRFAAFKEGYRPALAALDASLRRPHDLSLFSSVRRSRGNRPSTFR